MSKKRFLSIILSGVILTKGLQTSITDTSSYLYYRTPHYQSPETIARQHYTDTWVEQIQSYPIDGVDVKSLAWTGEAIYDEKKSKNNHNDCDLDFGDYTENAFYLLQIK